MTTDTLLKGFSIEIVQMLPDPHGGVIIQYAIVANEGHPMMDEHGTIQDTILFNVLLPPN